MSLEPEEMKRVAEGIRFVHEILGTAAWASVAAESDILQYRRYS